jgi:hypothetical protein
MDRMSRTAAYALAAALLAALPRAAACAPPPAAAAPAHPFGPQARARALDRIAALIESKYVYKDKAAAIAAEVRALESDPELARARDQEMWAAILGRRLKAHDIHFNVSWAPPGANRPVLTAAAAPPSPEAMDRMMAADNYGFQAVERLPGNIGYVRMSYFADFDRDLTGDKTPGARRAGEAVLRLISNTDAVIFDLRQNGGGSPDMIDLLLSGFFGDKPVLLNRFYQREGDRKIDFTTLADYAGPRRPNVPIYVLVSGRTGSAAEEFAYDVQTQKRGLIVGETTAGGANPGAPFDAGDGFQVFVSFGAAINPITGTNWEGVGVKPDVAVASADALSRAQTLALETVLKQKASTTPVEARWTLERRARGRASDAGTGGRLRGRLRRSSGGVRGRRAGLSPRPRPGAAADPAWRRRLLARRLARPARHLRAGRRPGGRRHGHHQRRRRRFELRALGGERALAEIVAETRFFPATPALRPARFRPARS